MCVVFEKSGRASYEGCSKDQQIDPEENRLRTYSDCFRVFGLHQHKDHSRPEENDMGVFVVGEKTLFEVPAARLRLGIFFSELGYV